MSTYAWERCSIKIPSSEWAGLKAAVRKQHNLKQEMGFSLSLALYHHLKESLKGKRNQHILIHRSLSDLEFGEFVVPKSALEDKAFDPKALGGGSYRFRIQPRSYFGEQYDFWCQVCSSVVVRKDGKLSLKKPLKKDWPMATNKTRYFSIGEASITFSDDAKKTVIWDVPDNNHAPERAREHSVAKALFHALDRITWTRGSGGVISGNDEYNRENCESGGGSNYTVESYGPQTSKGSSRRLSVNYRTSVSRHFLGRCW